MISLGYEKIFNVHQIKRKRERFEKNEKIELCKRYDMRLDHRTRIKRHFDGPPRNLYLSNNSNHRQQ